MSRKARWALIVAVMVVVAIGIGFLVGQRGPEVKPGVPVLDITPQVTVLTEPTDANGDIDYVCAVNLRFSQGVSVENNAAIHYVRAIGPKPHVDALDHRIYELLGMEKPDDAGSYFQRYEQWQRERDEDKANENWLLIEQQFEYCLDHFWTRAEFPELSQWVEDSSTCLDHVYTGSLLPDFYYPLLDNQDPRTPRLIMQHLSLDGLAKSIANLLSMRAKLSLAENDYNAWKRMY